MDLLALYIYFIYAMLYISGLLIILAIYECFSPGNKWIFWVSGLLGIGWLWGYLYQGLRSHLYIPRFFWYPVYMNDVNFDKPLNKYIFESCIDCGKFIRTNDKTKLILFMMEHYGGESIKVCSKTWYGYAVYTLLNWKYRNV